jgi:hypothetical protein
MAVVTGASVLAIVESIWFEGQHVMLVALWIVVLGTGFTVARRTARLLRVLNG